MALRMSPLADSTMMSRASFEGESAVRAGWEEKCLVSNEWRALRRSVGAIGLNLDMYNNKNASWYHKQYEPRRTLSLSHRHYEKVPLALQFAHQELEPYLEPIQHDPP
jgi:hypothetical protein